MARCGKNKTKAPAGAPKRRRSAVEAERGNGPTLHVEAPKADRRRLDDDSGATPGHRRQRLLAIWERVAGDLGPLALESAAYHARTAIRFGWMFWDAAYRSEQWAA